MKNLEKYFSMTKKYSPKFSAAVIYAILSAVAMNFFFVPGKVYSSGVNGLAQIISAVSEQWLPFRIPLSLGIWLINLPLFILAWKSIGKRFTVFTVITVTLSVFFIRLIPNHVLTDDPIINAVFGGVVSGAGIGYALKNGLSSGGLDVISVSIRKKTGHNVGMISFSFNFVIVLLAGFLFGFEYALYTILTVFVSGKVTDAIFTSQKKIQAMIITKDPDKVASHIHQCLGRGVTMIRSAEGAYTHSKQSVLYTVLTAAEVYDFRKMIYRADKNAFVSIQENVKIMGNFYEDDF